MLVNMNTYSYKINEGLFRIGTAPRFILYIKCYFLVALMKKPIKQM